MTVNRSGTKVVTSHFDSSFHEIDFVRDQNIRYRVNQDNTASSEIIRGVG